MDIIIEQNLTDVDFAGRRFKVLNREFELVFLMIHGAKHMWERLKWLYDIKDYQLDSIDKNKFYKIAEELKAERIISQTNILLKKYFNLNSKFGTKKHVHKYLVWKSIKRIEIVNNLDKSFKELLSELYYSWLLFPAFKYKMGIINCSLFRLGDISEIDSSFKFVYFLYRPYSFIKRRILNAKQ